jgi:hypothetical protein
MRRISTVGIDWHFFFDTNVDSSSGEKKASRDIFLRCVFLREKLIEEQEERKRVFLFEIYYVNASNVKVHVCYYKDIWGNVHTRNETDEQKFQLMARRDDGDICKAVSVRKAYPDCLVRLCRDEERFHHGQLQRAILVCRWTFSIVTGYINNMPALLDKYEWDLDFDFRGVRNLD